ncbi:hypothetical protein E9536_40540 [Burkholderia sp. LS-044]|uniref:Ig-like domain-containing protein n=1 Tax=Burkholderia sp. LS-044 TaxID=1459967 RepID=UPI0010A68DF6|nr:Ig-like domain-containing protein [Burkholderia sp. LS-044]THJ45982.1 hypothetical protein E9536_40540 [Burkholderia sp. LS-044]
MKWFAITFENRSPFTLKLDEAGVIENTNDGWWEDIPDTIEPYGSIYLEISNDVLSPTDHVSAQIPFMVIGQDALTGEDAFFSRIVILANAKKGQAAINGLKVESAPYPKDRQDILMFCDALEDVGRNNSSTNTGTQNYLVYFYSPGVKAYGNEVFSFSWNDHGRGTASDARINEKGEVELVFKGSVALTKFSKKISYVNLLDAKKYPKQGGNKVLLKDSVEEGVTLSNLSFSKKYTGEDIQFDVEFWDPRGITDNKSFRLVRAVSKDFSLKVADDDASTSTHIGSFPGGTTIQVLKSGKPVGAGIPVYCTIDSGTTNLQLTQTVVKTNNDGVVNIFFDDGWESRVGIANITARVLDEGGVAASTTFQRVIFEERRVQMPSNEFTTIGANPLGIRAILLDELGGDAGASPVAGVLVNFRINSGETGLRLSTDHIKTNKNGLAVVYVEGATSPGTAKVTASADYATSHLEFAICTITVKPKA